MDTSPAHTEGRRVLELEARTVSRLAESLDADAFDRAVAILIEARAQVVVTGMGKSGHIGAKVAATLASTGTPAFFLHPAEALHGDLGMLTHDNVLLAFSQSGTTEEVLNLLPFIQSLRIPLVAVTGARNSPLAERAAVVLLSDIEEEACPFNLAPTASTTAQLALGDALAMATMRRRGFQPEDFAVRHPLGALGRRLLFKVRDLMTSGDATPVVRVGSTLQGAIHAMTRKRFGAAIVVNEAGGLEGIFCDGDLRRLWERVDGRIDGTAPIETVMIPKPRHVHDDLLGVKAVDLMETHAITVLPVLDREEKVVGIIHLHDLIRAGIAR